jgi:hypothetical protein
MAKKKFPSRTTRTTAAKKAAKTKVKSVKSSAKKKVKVSAKTKRSVSDADASAKKTVRKPIRGRSQSAVASGAKLLTQAEADITTVIEALNNQMNSALTALTELVSAQGQRDKAVVRTAPLDRATSMFHRLVRQVVDEQLAEMLPPLITLRNEIVQYCHDNEPNGLPNNFGQRAQEILDNVLTIAGVQVYEAQIGDPFDPLIHLAVGEANRQDLADGVVVEQLQPGFRTTHGKVLAAAKVRINRR